MIDRKMMHSISAILASIVISAKDFPLREAHMGARAFYHIPQADDGWARIGLPYRLDKAATVEQQLSFASEQKAHGSLG